MSLLTQASLIVTPNAVKASKLYSIIPSNGNGDMDVVRATTATRVNSLGLIESVAANVPRLNYDGSCPSILVESQRTNLDTTSQTFSSWTLNNSGGVTTASVIATNPYGFATVQKVIPSAVIGQHRPLVSANYSANGRIWVIAKADGYNFLSLGEGGGVNGSNIIFNLSNGTISGSQVAYTPSITPLGNGWYKCSINTIFTGLILKLIVIRNNNTLADYVGDGTSGVLIAHKQLEVGEYDTSSILTNGGTVTRNADVISKTGISDLIGQTEGTLFCDLRFTNVGTEKYIITVSDTTNANAISLRRMIGGEVRVVFAATTSSGTTNQSSAVLPNGNYKLAYTYKSGSLKLFINGVLSFTLTPTFTFGNALQKINIGTDQFNLLQLGDSIKSIQIYKTALTDTECISLTTL